MQTRKCEKEKIKEIFFCRVIEIIVMFTAVPVFSLKCNFVGALIIQAQEASVPLSTKLATVSSSEVIHLVVSSELLLVSNPSLCKNSWTGAKEILNSWWKHTCLTCFYNWWKFIRNTWTIVWRNFGLISDQMIWRGYHWIQFLVASLIHVNTIQSLSHKVLVTIMESICFPKYGP